MHRTYFHNDFIFVRPAISTEFIESDPPTYRSYYPNGDGLSRFDPAHLPRFRLAARIRGSRSRRRYDVAVLCRIIWASCPAPRPISRSRCSAAAFYRNKGAYVIGKAVNGADEYPFAVPVLHDAAGQLCARYHHARRLAHRRAVLAVARLFHGRHAGAGQLCPVPAHHHAQQAALPSFNHARPGQAGQDHVLSAS